ncbi:hypothetical protein BDU57DRAFT_541336 [Ampelomyces quisqualis]|uniref:Uncharacterized protein n=1 Tax=Ampelomyces quisqualis TaxID=50730 RepID=A0A6A5QEU4_AMPQU|nr:hypothetical protein BDU57DRAFT_541336 [Ampelomyces quisqualis]
MVTFMHSRLPRSLRTFSKTLPTTQVSPSMTEESGTQPFLGRSIASHLEITIDSNDPPPAATLAFTHLRRQTQDIWHQFETAERSLIPLDDQVNEKILEYVSVHKRATGPELRIERARFTIRLYEPRVSEAEKWCNTLETAISALEKAALKEPTTVEGRATLEIDVGVMTKNLITTRDILQVAQSQLQRAISIMNPS